MGAELIIGPVLCAVISVYDGDTVTAVCKPWPQLTVKVSVRVNGVDTPEIRGKCPEEKHQAILARDAMLSIIGSEMELRNIHLGKFAGRVVADVYKDGENVAAILIGRGLGRAYDGGKREKWCDD